MFGKVTNICCTVDKNSPDKKHYSSKHTTLEEVGLELAHTVTTHEPNLGVHHANVVIQIREVDKEYVENTIVKSRAEQSSLMAA